jgi:ketosteroid isomerase-like protein
VFTYVPYFMHNPFWGEAASMPRFQPDPEACDNACLDSMARALVGAIPGNNWQDVAWGNRVGYSENSVGIRVGESLWRGITAIDDSPLVVADELTGKAVWIGRVEEHGQPAWAAFTVAADGDRVGSVDVLVRRSNYGPPFAEPVSAPGFPVLPGPQRTSRDAMAEAAGKFMQALGSNASTAPDVFAPDCRWLVNGQDVGLCTAAFGSPPLARIEQVREREVLAVDEDRGLIALRFHEDIPASDGQGYPLTYQVVEVSRFEDGRITRLEAFTSELPYGMRPR